MAVISASSTGVANINAGVRMLRNIEDRYVDAPDIDPLDTMLFIFASYNAGASRIAKLRKEAQEQGLNPDKWCGNVEFMVAKDIGQGTVTYVGDVYKYFVAYTLAMQGLEDRGQPEACHIRGVRPWRAPAPRTMGVESCPRMWQDQNASIRCE